MLIKRGLNTIAEVGVPLQSSNYTKSIMGEEQITLVWEAPAFVALYPGDYVVYEGANFTLNSLPTVKKISSNRWQYNAVFQSTKYDMAKAMYMLFDNTGTPPQGEFSLTGTADTFIDLLIANLNRVAGSPLWSVGQVVENTDFKTLTFTNEDCLTVLARLASEFNTEYHVANRLVHLKRISTERQITLQYGSTLYDIERASTGGDIATRLYAFGSTKNLAADYRGGNSPLRIPVSAGEYIENNVAQYGVIEKSITFDDIYPRLSSGGAGIVTGVGNYLEFTDSALDFNINDYLLDGTKAKVHFNTGECAGYDFEIASYNHATKTFVLIPNTQENDFTLPTDDLKPAVGDKYVLLDIIMPPAYLAAAEAELLTRAQEYLSQNSTPKVSYKTTFSAIYAKQNLQNVECGDTVTVYDADMGINEEIRIVKLTKGLTDFWTVQFDLSNTVTATRLERIEGNLAAVENNVIVTNQRVNRNNLRAYQNTKELREMVFDPDGYFDAENIKPLSIETSMLSVGAKSQSFQLSSLLQPNYAGNPQVLQWSAGLLTHFTIVDDAIKEWTISQGSITITGANEALALYIYARCLRSGSTGDIYLSPAALKFDDGSTYYYFLIGVLHTPLTPPSGGGGAVRGISLTYGQTTINGQFIKTGVISSIDGATYFNLNTGEIGGNIKFRSTSGALKTVEQAIDEVEVGGRNLLKNTSNFVDLNGWNSFGEPANSATIVTHDGKKCIKLSVYGSSAGYVIAVQSLDIPLLKDTDYILSFKYKSLNRDFLIYAYSGAVTNVNSWWKPATDIFENAEIKFNTGNGDQISQIRFDCYEHAPTGVSEVYLYDIKLEKGNKATDWSPAPEDIQLQIDETNSYIEAVESDLQNQIDGQIIAWFKEYNPTLANEPASLWATADEKNRHANDTFTNTLTGASWRWQYVSGAWQWGVIADTATQQALLAASKAQDTADSKRRTFTAQPLTSQAYDVGDLWVNATVGSFTNDLLKCKTAKAVGVAFNVAHWEKASKYTDDTAVQNLKPAGKNYLIGSRTDNVTGWVLSGGTAIVVTDAQYGKVVEYSRPAGGGDFMKSFTIDTSELKNTELVYYCIAKPISGTTIFNFGGWQETFTMLNNNSPYRDLGNGWRLYYKTFTADSAIASGVTFGLNSVGGTWRFHSFGVAKGNTPPSDWDASPKEIDFLKQGYQASTDIEGGVVQTAILLLRNLAEQVTAGMSGLGDDNIGMWAGGTYQEALNSIAKIILRKDGSGQLAGGNITWDAAGALELLGKITAGSGKIGGLDIFSNSLKSASMSFSETPVELLASLISPSSVSISNQSSWSVNSNTGTATAYSQNFVIPFDSQIKFKATATPWVSGLDRRWSVTVQQVGGSVVFSQTGNGAITGQLFTVNVPAGTYVIRATASCTVTLGQTPYDEASITGETSGVIYAYGYNFQTKIGNDGFYSFWDALKFLYYNPDTGLVVRGATDIPAGLGGASINSSGGVVSGSQWGKMTIQGNGVAKNGSNYTITHYIGDTNYSLILTPISANVPYFSSKSANTVVVTCAGGFDFVLIRTK